MRWDNLFDDLLGQLDRELASERADERRDVARSHIADISCRQILTTLAQGKTQTTRLRTPAATLVGQVDTVGADWLAFSTRHHELQEVTSAHVIPLDSITSLEIGGGASVVQATCGVFLREGDDSAALATPVDPPDRASTHLQRPRLIDRITFATVLRDLARRRRWVDIATIDGAVAGTLDAVGRDWCEVAQHPRDVARRQSAITGSILVPLSAVCDVRVG